MARLFNGSTDHITTSSVATSATTNLTCAQWIYPNAGHPDNDTIANGVAASNGFRIYLANLVLHIVASGVSDVTTTGTFTAATWGHAAFSLDGSQNLNAYFNGANVKTGVTLGVRAGTGQTTIGANDSGPNTLDGRVADTAIWSTVLTASEIGALAKGARPNSIRPSSLVAWWPLDGLSSPEPDLSGKKLNGTVTGTSLAAGPPVTLFAPKPPVFSPAFTSILYGHNIGANFTRRITTIGY